MKKHCAMRNAIAIALLLLVLFQTAGHLFVFKIQQHEIRREIKQRIKAGVPEKELALLKIPKTFEKKNNAVFQRLHEREFRYDGKMYDVVRQEAHGDTTWYYCLTDEKETQLFANLEELAKSEMNRNPEQKLLRVRLLDLLGALFLNHHEDLAPAYSVEDVELPNHLFSLKTWVATPLTPPPEA